MKKVLLSMGITAVVMSSGGITAFAAKGSASLNASEPGWALANGYKVVLPGMFSQGKQTYIPLWYAIEALHRAGVSSKWVKDAWMIQIPGLSIKKPIQSLNDSGAKVFVNGKLIAQLPGLIKVDPFSHKPTFYIKVSNISLVTDALGWDASFQNGIWEAKSPSIMNLEKAMNQTATASYYQTTMQINETMQTQWASSITQSAQTSPKSLPSSMNMSGVMHLNVGTVDGQHAVLTTMNMNLHAPNTKPMQFESYLQGNKLYNLLPAQNGEAAQWQVSTVNGQLEQLINHPELSTPFSLSLLRNVHVISHSEGDTIYEATLNSTGFSQFMSNILSQGGLTTMLSQKQMTSEQAIEFMKNLFQHVTMKETLTVTGEGANAKITHESVDMSINITPDMFGDLSTEIAQTMTNMHIQEQVEGTFTYQNIPIIPPDNLPSGVSNPTTVGTTYGNSLTGL